MNQISNPESIADTFMAALDVPAQAAFFEEVSTLATLHHLVQCLQDALLDGQGGMLVFNGPAIGDEWGDLLDRAHRDQHTLVILTNDCHPDHRFLVSVLGIQGGAVVYASEQEQNSDSDHVRLFRLRWSFAPPVIEQALDAIEQHLVMTASHQLDHWHGVRRMFALRPPDLHLIVRLLSDLLAFARQQEQTQMTAYANLLARLRWYEDQTRMMVHDIRGPLHNVLVSLKALLSQQQVSSGQYELLHVGYESALFLDNMIDTMMDALRLEAGKLPLHYEPLQVAVLVRSVCEPFEVTTRAGLPHLHYTIPDKLPLLRADRRLLERVLNNLIDNAMKFTPPEGSVSISAQLSADQSAIEISVADTGRGIHPDAQPHIFQRFYQTSEKDHSRGVGLGLYFCRVAVEAHGGVIRFSSTLDLGTNFIVVLPLVPAEQ